MAVIANCTRQCGGWISVARQWLNEGRGRSAPAQLRTRLQKFPWVLIPLPRSPVAKKKAPQLRGALVRDSVDSRSQLKTSESADLNIFPDLRDLLGDDFFHRLLWELYEWLIDQADGRIKLIEFSIDDFLSRSGRLS